MGVHKVPRGRHASRKAMARLRSTRVWVNGADVTRDCFYADTRRGVVRMFIRNEQGLRYMHRGRPARVEARGRVRVKVAATRPIEFDAADVTLTLHEGPPPTSDVGARNGAYA